MWYGPKWIQFKFSLRKHQTPLLPYSSSFATHSSLIYEIIFQTKCSTTHFHLLLLADQIIGTAWMLNLEDPDPYSKYYLPIHSTIPFVLLQIFVCPVQSICKPNLSRRLFSGTLQSSWASIHFPLWLNTEFPNFDKRIIPVLCCAVALIGLAQIVPLRFYISSTYSATKRVTHPHSHIFHASYIFLLCLLRPSILSPTPTHLISNKIYGDSGRVVVVLVLLHILLSCCCLPSLSLTSSNRRVLIMKSNLSASYRRRWQWNPAQVHYALI